MLEFLAVFFTWQFLTLCLGIASITYIIRKFLEWLILNRPSLPGNPKSSFWRDFLLPVMPILLGLVIGLFGTAYPFPDQLGPSQIGRSLFGMVAGFFSGLIYRVIVATLKSNLPGQYTDPSQAQPGESPFIKAIRATINKDPIDPTADISLTDKK